MRNIADTIAKRNDTASRIDVLIKKQLSEKGRPQPELEEHLSPKDLEKRMHDVFNDDVEEAVKKPANELLDEIIYLTQLKFHLEDQLDSIKGLPEDQNVKHNFSSPTKKKQKVLY